MMAMSHSPAVELLVETACSAMTLEGTRLKLPDFVEDSTKKYLTF